MEERVTRLFDSINESRKNREALKAKEWNILKERIFSVHTDQEILELRDDVNAFMKSAAPEEDKTRLSMYVEPLAIMVAGVKRRMNKDN